MHPADSEEILTELINTHDTTRIAAGVPKGVAVPTKIGSFSNQSQSDCGIIYEPNRPFMICILIFNGAQDADHYFSDLSKLAYNYVHNYKIPAGH